jgi:hypothetical protein
MLRGLAVWVLIMSVETIHGILRGIFLVPLTGQLVANRIGWPFGMMIVMVTSIACARWIGIRDTRSLIRLGGIWAALTFIFEVLIGFARGLNSGQILSEINFLQGGLMIYSLAIMAIAPWAAAKVRRL